MITILFLALVLLVIVPAVLRVVQDDGHAVSHRRPPRSHHEPFASVRIQ